MPRIADNTVGAAWLSKQIACHQIVANGVFSPPLCFSFVGRLSGAVEAAATRAHQVVAGCLQRVGTKDEGPLPHTEAFEVGEL